MPPRIPIIVALCRPPPVGSLQPLTAFLMPFQQARSASILANLSDTPGSYNKRYRVGRGPSSGKGRTAGRGSKGQKAHGKVPARFQGGQTPQWIVHGPRGFTNHFTDEMSPVNLDRIQAWIDQGRIDPAQPITLKELVQTRCIHGIKDGVKLLARGKEDLKTPINILVSRASAAAIEAVEAAGGKITTRYYTREAIQRLLKGESESSWEPLVTSMGDSPILEAATSGQPFKYRLPDPTSRKDLEYYRDSSKRGYLSHLVAEGEGPSLFFKAPTGIKRKTRKSEKDSGERLW